MQRYLGCTLLGFMVDSAIAMVFAKKKLVSGDVWTKIMGAVLICNKNRAKFDEKFF